MRGVKIQRNCEQCGISFLVIRSEVKRGKGRLCSLACSAKKATALRDQTGSRNPNWKGGKKKCDRKRRYAEKHPEKATAHAEMTKAIRSGRLVRKPCEKCGNEKVEGHHTDYSRPLDVVWLCKTHHLEAHGGRLDNGL